MIIRLIIELELDDVEAVNLAAQSRIDLNYQYVVHERIANMIQLKIHEIWGVQQVGVAYIPDILVKKDKRP